MLAYWGHSRHLVLLCLGEMLIIAVGNVVPPSLKLPEWIRQEGEIRQAGFSPSCINWVCWKTSLVYHLRNDVRQLKFDYVLKFYTSESYSILNCWFCSKPGSKMPMSHVKQLHNLGVKVFHVCLSGLTWSQRSLLPLLLHPTPIIAGPNLRRGKLVLAIGRLFQKHVSTLISKCSLH